MQRGLIALAILMLGALASGLRPTTARYLYVVGCDALVDKLDTVADRKTGAYDLAKRTGKEQLIPSVRGTLDGCLAYQAVYDTGTSVFYTVVPVEAEPKPDGTKDYFVLGFTVPSLRLVKKIPGGRGPDGPPHIDMSTGKHVKILKAGEWLPRTDLDLSTFAPDKARIPNQILEASGRSVLLRIFTADEGELVLAVADRESKILTRLKGIPATVSSSVHLAPGGAHVLVEETTGGGSKVVKTGRLVLWDSKTGELVKTFSDERVRQLYFLAISPTGKAIYHSDAAYYFISLGTTYSSDAVTRPVSTGYPGLFFSDR